MIIVNCLGGLGNQMFQYAFYRSLKTFGANVRLDISGFINYNLHNGFELERIFAIKPEYATRDERDKLLHTNLLLKVLKKLKMYNRHIIQKKFGFDSRYYKISGNYFLDGYWQSEDYFINCAKQIRQDFVFPEIDSRNREYITLIKNTNSVAIHVRRGDYINHQLHGDISTLEYYKAAISLIREKVGTPKFFVFSDDVNWCRNNLVLDGAVYITGNVDINSYRDMQLMSLCKHNIIANSSFSWWSAWLNQNPDKIVIAPSKWFNDETINITDIIPKLWIKI